MGMFDRSLAREYAVRRKLAKGLLRWQRTLGTVDQLEQPRVSELLPPENFRDVTGALFNLFDTHVKAVWDRLAVKNRSLFLQAEARQGQLGYRGSSSSDTPSEYVPLIIT